MNDIGQGPAIYQTGHYLLNASPVPEFHTPASYTSLPADCTFVQGPAGGYPHSHKSAHPASHDDSGVGDRHIGQSCL